MNKGFPALFRFCGHLGHLISYQPYIHKYFYRPLNKFFPYTRDRVKEGGQGGHKPVKASIHAGFQLATFLRLRWPLAIKGGQTHWLNLGKPLFMRVSRWPPSLESFR